MSKAKCKGWSSGGFSGHYCHKDLKTDEQIDAKLCGRHLAGKRRREANNMAHNEERVCSGKRLAKAEKVVARLAKLGINAYPHYSGLLSAHTGRIIVVDGEALADLLEESS